MNGGRDDADEPAEVCFDSLARYTYASADPRLANSMLNDIVMNPIAHQNNSSPGAVTQKTRIMGNAVVAIRALPRTGWVKVTARRAPGLTRILARKRAHGGTGGGRSRRRFGSCNADHGPRVARRGKRIVPGARVFRLLCQSRAASPPAFFLPQDIVRTFYPPKMEESEEAPPPRPDPITGYVWQRSAPSQRWKEVAFDSSLFSLQPSQYGRKVG